MKKLAALSFPLFLSFFVSAQDLEIKSGPKGLYLIHKVAPKEGLFPLGRMYNVHPRHIANFNGIDFNKGLAIGQLINIPLTDTNFKREVNTGVPVYYKTGGKESLANISVKFKAPINNLRGWNRLNDDNAGPNSKLIVGFLITNELKDKVVTVTPQVEESVSNVKKADAQKKMVEPEVKEPEPKKEEPKTVADEAKKDPPAIVKEEPRKTEPVVARQPETTDNDGTGFFKNNFYQQVKGSPLSKEQTVTSSIFKTMSGWQDGKYYLLINGVEPGTIVKLTNPSNSKVVFAKVLYAMDKIRENQGVDIRISDAAAASLAIHETDKFILKVNY
ncbi:MAG TPA: LysM peptidoglycan-binding domain-containing protein [Chitinophagaceae bacterium]|nr:LysM peptidoglycan-binding domain-containing protein [Chitinophagaceae bacterium]